MLKVLLRKRIRVSKRLILVTWFMLSLLETFILRTGHENVQLRSEKETDGETGGEEEFVIVDLIQVRRRLYSYSGGQAIFLGPGHEAMFACDKG
ncbi:hypothetical protein EV426DRAFT_626030 [Tirmania nivea]|nr:hypothetical protein EV426DRAFT_626030 [Tirmania nivea]